jgi:hypothetical protein
VNHDDSIRRLATVTDEQAARTVTRETRADLAEQIMATAVEHAPARRRRVLRFGVPLAVVAAGAAAAPASRTSARRARSHRVRS